MNYAYKFKRGWKYYHNKVKKINKYVWLTIFSK